MACHHFSNFSQAQPGRKSLDSRLPQHERSTMHHSHFSLARLLFSNGPASDRADKMGLYGWLVGDWTMDAVMHAPDGVTHERSGEISVAWVLEGRRSRMSGYCRTFSTARRSACTTQASTLGRSSGAIRSGNSTADRSAERTEQTSSNWGSPTMATIRAGALPISPQTRSAGWANSRPMAERRGGCAPNSNVAANHDIAPDRGGLYVRSRLHRRPQPRARQAILRRSAPPARLHLPQRGSGRTGIWARQDRPLDWQGRAPGIARPWLKSPFLLRCTHT